MSEAAPALLPYAVFPAHLGVVNRYVIKRRVDKKVVGTFWAKSDAFAACRVMNEMAVATIAQQKS